MTKGAQPLSHLANPAKPPHVQYFTVLGKGLHLVDVCGACHSVQALTTLSNANILGSVQKQNVSLAWEERTRKMEE